MWHFAVSLFWCTLCPSEQTKELTVAVVMINSMMSSTPTRSCGQLYYEFLSILAMVDSADTIYTELCVMMRIAGLGLGQKNLQHFTNQPLLLLEEPLLNVRKACLQNIQGGLIPSTKAALLVSPFSDFSDQRRHYGPGTVLMRSPLVDVRCVPSTNGKTVGPSLIPSEMVRGCCRPPIKTKPSDTILIAPTARQVTSKLLLWTLTNSKE